ncbi:Probable transcriptional regulatory protein YebC [Salmonella enterica subsp. enterica]|uniref:Probable transcriptional regulatory protein YebC n=1 Tax=Salmonella enterica I TaxID=59201 RepID=A0A447N8U4_SALET|nr:Probable transcriptional regulatory protein YebC [Salmonella enterica subsp. enterica]
MMMARLMFTLPGKRWAKCVTRWKRRGLKADSAEVSMIPSTKADMDAETAPKLLRLIDMLEDCDDVQEVYHNGEISDEVAATL